LPDLLGSLVEPALGILGDSGRRRPIVLGGGLVFAAAVGGVALARDFPALFLLFLIGAPASGAFVSLSQASLMDLDPSSHDRSMARWAVAGSFGALAGPLALAASASLGLGWRWLMAGLGAATIPMVLAARRIPLQDSAGRRDISAAVRGALRALRRRDVVRWLVLLETSDLMGDVLYGFVALYFVDVVRVDPVVAGLAVVVLGAAGVAGDVLLLPVLARVDGARYLRVSAVLVTVVFPAFLLVHGTGSKLVLLALLGLLRAGWYAVPMGRLFTAMADSSGTAIALSNVSGLIGNLTPLAIGALAERVGLAGAMWVLLLAPVALVLGLPTAGGSGGSMRPR
jgi:MFS transporter, FSR family, fosmidomycin resistance protein